MNLMFCHGIIFSLKTNKNIQKPSMRRILFGFFLTYLIPEQDIKFVYLAKG